MQMSFNKTNDAIIISNSGFLF